MLYYWRISRFERHNGHKMQWKKSHFDLKVGISCREETHARIKPSRDFCPQTTFATSVTSFTCHCTACVWQGNSEKMTVGVTSWVQPVAYLGFHKEGKFLLATIVLTQFLKRGKPSFPIFCQHFFLDKRGHSPIPPLNTPLSSASVMALVTGGSEIGQSARSIMSKYSTASKFGFAGTLNLCTCLLRSVALAFIIQRNPSSHISGRWSVIMARSRFSGWAKYSFRWMTGSTIFLYTWRWGILTWLGECVAEV